MNPPTALPIVDISSLHSQTAAPHSAPCQIRESCERDGFFYVVGHEVPPQLFSRLEELSREFFSLDSDSKRQIEMSRGGAAWRGYFPVGEELTSGKPDQKEGLYFGAELDATHPRVASRIPLHGPNLFPAIDGFRETVLEYMDRMTTVGQAILRGIALSLGLEAGYLLQTLTAEPTVLFRIFHYPPLPVDPSEELWSVGEHTDYGLLTLLKQDTTGGLQIKSKGHWIKAPPMDGALVCNLGDMLDRMTGGRYRSTPHRVRNTTGKSRLSFPFFLDPSWDAQVRPIPGLEHPAESASNRWDGADLSLFSGTYGEYLLQKVAKVFPDLSNEELS